MTIEVWLKQATEKLERAGIETPRLDCLVLLEDQLDQERARLLAHPQIALTAPQIGILSKKITQRAAHKPLAYIRGKAIFYGREFGVNPHVLVPRPETESIIDLLKQLTDLSTSPALADIGSGSGCLGITAALEIPKSNLHFYDIDADALAVTKHNAQHYKVKAHYYQGDLLEHYLGPYDVLLANLPYVPTNYTINQAATFEPPMALFAGVDGLNLYRAFWHQVAQLPVPPRHIITEALPDQHTDLCTLAHAAGYACLKTDRFAQLFSLSAKITPLAQRRE